MEAVQSTTYQMCPSHPLGLTADASQSCGQLLLHSLGKTGSLLGCVSLPAARLLEFTPPEVALTQGHGSGWIDASPTNSSHGPFWKGFLGSSESPHWSWAQTAHSGDLHNTLMVALSPSLTLPVPPSSFLPFPANQLSSSQGLPLALLSKGLWAQTPRFLSSSVDHRDTGSLLVCFYGDIVH